MKLFTPALVLTLMTAVSIAQAQPFEWKSEMDSCQYQGDFDPNKYSVKQIENSQFVLESLTESNLNSFSAPSNIGNLDKALIEHIEVLTEEYKQVKNHIEQLDVVPEAEKHKQELLKTIDDEYKTTQLTILAYQNPEAAIKQSPPMCKHYIGSLLEDEQRIQNKWKQVIEEKIQQQAQRGAVYLKAHRLSESWKYEKQKNEDPAFYARQAIISSGFNSCLKSTAYRPERKTVSANYAKLNRKIFGDKYTGLCVARQTSR